MLSHFPPIYDGRILGFTQSLLFGTALYNTDVFNYLQINTVEYYHFADLTLCSLGRKLYYGGLIRFIIIFAGCFSDINNLVVTKHIYLFFVFY